MIWVAWCPSSYLHYQTASGLAGKPLVGWRFPSEVADRDDETGKSPAGHYEDVCPVEGAAKEAGLHAGEEVLEGEDPADSGHPGWRVVPERDKDAGQE
jgi:hypothetical protein